MEGADKLIMWYLENGRDLPWRSTRNPYHIWLSEIILQQTRVDQGMAYYFNFVDTYPTVKDLANASENDVLKLWQGLGYYSRARNLLATARKIAFELNGVFPENYDALLGLKGVGPYTAAAIASFAFDLPQAVVDGNVSRVLSRLFNIDEPINSSAGAKMIRELAEASIQKDDPANYNQAIMELGAMICTPTSPKCHLCPLSQFCISLAENTIGNRPVKIKNKKALIRQLDYAVIENDDTILFKKRSGKDIWQGLCDFAAVEGMAEPQAEYVSAFVTKNFPELIIKSRPLVPEKEYTHILTHQKIKARFWRYKTSGKISKESVYFSVSKNEIEGVAVPRLLHRYLEDVSLL